MNSDDIKITEAYVKENPQRLLGSTMLCPHCNQLLRVIRVGTSINGAYDPAGQWNSFVLIELEDGEWSRFWLNEYPNTPSILREYEN
jgi:hypothetical protein